MLVWFSDYTGLAKHSTEVSIRYTYSVFFILYRFKKTNFQDSIPEKLGYLRTGKCLIVDALVTLNKKNRFYSYL